MKCSSLCRTLAVLPAALLVSVVLSSASASAASPRVHSIQFNACDQFQRPGKDPKCSDVAPVNRATAIRISVDDFGANTLSLQELCRSTYNELLNTQLGGSGAGWRGVFSTTVAIPAGDRRCTSAGGGDWGVAVLVKGASFSSVDGSVVGYDPKRGPNGTIINGEQRRLLCGNTSILGNGFRLCSTHLTVLSGELPAERDTRNRQQINVVADRTVGRANGGAALLIGGDFNRNLNDCSTSFLTPFDRLYRGGYGDTGNPSRPGGCRDGYGPFYEADHRVAGSSDFDEGTVGNSKLDLTFFNYQRYYGDYGGDARDSTVSDHRLLRGAMTLHP